MADYQDVLADLKSRRANLDRERTALDTAIAALERLAERPPQTSAKASDRPATGHRVGQNAFAHMLMPQAVLTFLAHVGEPQTARQIREGVIAGGAHTSPNARGHVYNTLTRLSEDVESSPIVRYTGGLWGLREWSGKRGAQ